MSTDLLETKTNTAVTDEALRMAAAYGAQLALSHERGIAAQLNQSSTAKTKTLTDLTNDVHTFVTMAGSSIGWHPPKSFNGHPIAFLECSLVIRTHRSLIVKVMPILEVAKYLDSLVEVLEVDVRRLVCLWPSSRLANQLKKEFAEWVSYRGVYHIGTGISPVGQERAGGKLDEICNGFVHAEIAANIALRRTQPPS